MQRRREVIDDLEIIELSTTAGGRRAIFLHGGPGMLGYMESFCESISSHCNAVYYEQRGSKQGNYDIGILDHLRDLKRIVDHYSEESRPIIVGHSWGAALAILFAERYSSSIQKVVLIACGPLNKIQGEQFQNELIVRFGNRRNFYDGLWYAIDEEKDEKKQQQLADHYIEQMMEIYQKDPESGLEVQPLYWDYKASFKTMCQSDECTSDNKYEKALSKIESPLTVIHGTYDVISPVSLFSLIRKYLPHARMIKLEKAGHYPWAGPCRKEFIEKLELELK